MVSDKKGVDGTQDIVLRHLTMLKHNNMQLKLLGEENQDLQDEIKYVRDIVKA
jgi:hypothetical protein